MKPYKPVKIYRWLSRTKKILYIFDSHDEYIIKKEKEDVIEIVIIKETIYIDDNIEDAINKIGLYIQNIDKKISFPIYAWSNNKSLLFDIAKIKWSEYDVNPFNSMNFKSIELDEQITYNFNKNFIFDKECINIVFNSDVPTNLQNNKYYFIERKIDSYKNYKKRDTLLLTLKNHEINSKIVSESYNRIDFIYKIKKNTNELFYYYDILKTNELIDLIQYVDDYSKILYKLSKAHRIPTNILLNWVNPDKINKNKIINLYSFFNRTGYCKITIDEDNNIYITYIIDIRRSIKWDDIMTHKKLIIEYLEKNMNQYPIKTQELSLNLNIKIEVANTNLNVIAKKIGEYYDIFHVISDIKKNKQHINCIYKRSSNYSQKMDIGEYIKSRFNIGISKKEIILELDKIGIQGDIERIVEDEIELLNKGDEINEKQNINLNENGTIVGIEVYGQGYNISVINCPNKNELSYMLFWLMHIIAIANITATKKIVNIKKNVHVVPVVPVVPVPIQPDNNDNDDSESDNEFGKLEYDLESDDEMNGGAKGNKKGKNTSYFINMLHQADNELFGENYAREKCQHHSQPVVISKQEKKELEKNNNLHFDNIIEYGSSESNQNYYACPRLWCPISKIPLDPNVDDAKCPLPDEEPIESFWDKDKNIKRYVKLKNQNKKGICAPCCMRKEPNIKSIEKCKVFLNKDKKTKDVESQFNEEDEDIKDNYIMNQRAPIPFGRFGNIPEYLHKLLLGENVNIEQCNKSLNKSIKCFVRKGISHNKIKNINSSSNNDSLLSSISYILNFKNKKELIKDIIKKIDIITYISLENGDICKEFMSVKALFAKDNSKLINEMKNANINMHVDYENEYSLSRMLNIYYSYKKFLSYLSNNEIDDKNPEYIYTIIKILYDIVLIIWEGKDKTENITFKCPYYSSYKEIIGNDLNPDIGMIIKDNFYYEPIEFKMRNTEGTKILKLKEYKELEEVINVCNIKDVSKSYVKLYTYNNWINSKILKNINKFKINIIYINDDLTIDKVMTKGNFLISFEKIRLSILPILIRDFKISNQNIRFYKDDVKKRSVFNNSIFKYDLELFSEKCHELKLTFNLGVNKKNTDIELYNTLTLSDEKISNGEIIHYDKNNRYYTLNNIEIINSNRYHKLQNYVGKVISSKYTDVMLNKLNNLSRIDRKRELLKLFRNMNKKVIPEISIILEEIPLNSKKDIDNWVNKNIINKKYNLFSNDIVENTKEFIFSQNVFHKNGERVLPSLFVDYNKDKPIKHFDTNIANKSKIEQTNIEYKDYVINNSSDKVKDIDDNLPEIFKGKEEKLSTKWTKNKKSKWNNIVAIKMDKYAKETIPEFVSWLSKKINTPVQYEEIVNSTKHKYYDIMNDKKLMFDHLEDPSYIKEWEYVSNKKFNTVQIFWNSFYEKLSEDKRIEYITNILKNNKLYTNDLNMLSISEILNVSILLIHRGKYGNFETTAEARGDIEDFRISSTFYPAISNINIRPLIIFLKTHDKDKQIYSLILDKNVNNLFMKYNDVPEYIKMLTNAHLEAKNK